MNNSSAHKQLKNDVLRLVKGRLSDIMMYRVNLNRNRLGTLTRLGKEICKINTVLPVSGRTLIIIFFSFHKKNYLMWGTVLESPEADLFISAIKMVGQNQGFLFGDFSFLVRPSLRQSPHFFRDHPVQKYKSCNTEVYSVHTNRLV